MHRTIWSVLIAGLSLVIVPLLSPEASAQPLPCTGFCDNGSYCENANCPTSKCYTPDSIQSLLLCGGPCPGLCGPSFGFGECVAGGYCGPVPPDCIGVCLVDTHPLSQVICGGAFQQGCGVGSCIGDSYCDDCLCYAPTSAVSQVFCNCEPKTPAELLAGTSEFLNMLDTALSGEQVVDPCVPAGDQICGSTIIGGKLDPCNVAASCLVNRAKTLRQRWGKTVLTDISRFGPTTAQGLRKAKRPLSDPTTTAALKDLIKLTKNQLRWIKKYQSCKSTESSAAKCTPASLDSQGTDLTVRLNDQVSRAANSYLFWPKPIPYARSPYVEDPATHKPAFFGDGYDGQTIPTPHPAMYLQHAGNYGDRPGCPSCLLYEGFESCQAFGCTTVGTGPEELCCREISGVQCTSNSPPSDCLQDPYGNVTQAGIDEAQKYYGNISKGLKLFDDSPTPVQLAFYDGSDGSGPQNFEEWQKVFGFDDTPAGGDCRKPMQNETILAWGVRCGCVWYYNKMELQLGRFICCTEFADRDDQGDIYGVSSRDLGVACMTGNFGKDFDQPKDGMMGSLEFKDNQNFVNVTTRPSRHAHFRTQWWAFKGMTLTQDANGVWSYGTIKAGEPPGIRLDAVLLDRARVRPIPLSCTNCHGGVYAPNDTCEPPKPIQTKGGFEVLVRGDADCGQVDDNCLGDGTCKEKHMVADTKFLPLNPGTLGFPDDPGFFTNVDATQTRAGQQQRLRKINLMMLKRPVDAMNYPDPKGVTGEGLTGGDGSDQLSGIQREWLMKLYGGDVDPTHAVAPKEVTTPDKWTNSASTIDLWNNVVLPGCANCHMAVKPQRPGTCGGLCSAGNTTEFTVASYDQFVNYDAHGAICKKEFHMPHAAPTQEWFWSSKQPQIKIGGTSYKTPRAAFFGAIQQKQGMCCGPDFYDIINHPFKQCSVTDSDSVAPPFDEKCDCPLKVPPKPEQVEMPLAFDPNISTDTLLYDGDGCAQLEFPSGSVIGSPRLNPEPSDNYCGLTKDVPGTPPDSTKGSDGMICDDSLVPQGICVLGCRLADPRTGVINIDINNVAIPFRGCPKGLVCGADDSCQ